MRAARPIILEHSHQVGIWVKLSVVVLNYQVETYLTTEAEGIKSYWGTGLLKVSPYL